MPIYAPGEKKYNFLSIQKILIFFVVGMKNICYGEKITIPFVEVGF
jgi:hypothetical protein